MNRIHTFNDTWTEWRRGSKFPIAFFGDSTFDGANTTEWTRNSIGVDNVSPNSFSRKLEERLRLAANNPSLRIYNAGFSGKTASWAVKAIDEVFSETSPYHDVKMIGIGFGINDRLEYPDEKAYRDGFKGYVEQMINWCYAKKIQPFLLTTQATAEPGVHTDYTVQYPLRTGELINSIANEVKRELAEEYRLQLIDLNRYTERFLLYSSHSLKRIISDRLHFGDIGHRYEADVIFSYLCPRTIRAAGLTKIDFSKQHVFDCIPENRLTIPDEPVDGFKIYADYSKESVEDMKLMAAWVLVDADKKLTLKAYKGDSADTYIKINGISKPLSGAETVVDRLEFGLYLLEAFTGASTRVDFKGFVLEN